MPQMTGKLNNKGSALVFAVLAGAILTLMVGIALTGALVYYAQSEGGNHMKQAYLTAKSVANALAQEISEGSEGGGLILDRISVTGESVTLYDVTFEGSDYDAGNAEALITRVDDNTILIDVKAVVGKKSRSISLRLVNGGGATDALGGEFPGLDISGDAINIGSAYSVNGYSSQDIYAKSGSTIVFMSTANFYGNLYAEDGATIQFSDSCHIHGSIYAQSGTNFRFNQSKPNRIGFDISSRIFVKDGATINVNGNSHTVTLKNNKVKTVPSNINSAFKEALAIFSASDITDRWVIDEYE